LTINNGLANGTTYNFCVSAVQNLYDSTGKLITSSTPPTLPTETFSATISAMPQLDVLAVPSAVSASAGNQQVSLSWAAVSDPSGGAVEYNIYYTNTAPSSTTNWILIGTTSNNSFVHSGLAAGETYYYVIKSVSDQGGQSAQSSPVSISL